LGSSAAFATQTLPKGVWATRQRPRRSGWLHRHDASEQSLLSRVDSETAIREPLSSAPIARKQRVGLRTVAVELRRHGLRDEHQCPAHCDLSQGCCAFLRSSKTATPPVHSGGVGPTVIIAGFVYIALRLLSEAIEHIWGRELRRSIIRALLAVVVTVMYVNPPAFEAGLAAFVDHKTNEVLDRFVGIFPTAPSNKTDSTP
jgi:hypothetical protein